MHSPPLSSSMDRFLVFWEECDWPLDLDGLFRRSAPLTLEIGFGNGDFLLNLAVEHPERNFMGIEIAWSSVQRLLRRIDQLHLENVRVMEGNGAYILENCFPEESLDEVYINFSDPWRKSRHHSRRLIQDEFIELLSRRMKKDADLIIATDHAEYADWIEDILVRQDRFLPVGDAPRFHHFPDRFTTRYEEKALAQGLPIHYFQYKSPGSASETTPTEGFGSMPNVILNGTLQSPPFPTDLRPKFSEKHHLMAVHIKFDELYRSTETGIWMAPVLISEGGFRQSLAFSLVPKDGAQTIVKVASIGNPRPTWGVKRALWHLANLTMEHHTLTVYTSSVGSFPSPQAAQAGQAGQQK